MGMDARPCVGVVNEMDSPLLLIMAVLAVALLLTIVVLLATG